MASNNPPISDVKLGELPAYFKKFKLNSIPRGFMGMVSRYQQKYLLCKNGKITPFLHVIGLAMFLNYCIEYKHLKHTSMMRKYH